MEKVSLYNLEADLSKAVHQYDKTTAAFIERAVAEIRMAIDYSHLAIRREKLYTTICNLINLETDGEKQFNFTTYDGVRYLYIVWSNATTFYLVRDTGFRCCTELTEAELIDIENKLKREYKDKPAIR